MLNDQIVRCFLFLNFFANRQFVMLGSGLMVVFCSFPLWHPAKAFAISIRKDMNETSEKSQWIKEDRKAKWTEFLGKYKLLKELVTLVNRAIGNIVTLYLCGSILAYGLQLDHIFTEFEHPNWRRVIVYVFSLSSDIFVYLLDAQICQNVCEPKNTHFVQYMHADGPDEFFKNIGLLTERLASSRRQPKRSNRY